MKKFEHIDTWVFDLDNTLYDASTGVFDRISDQMTAYVSDLLKLPEQEASALRRHYWKTYGTTLFGLMKEHKVDPHHFLHHAHDVKIDDVAPCGIIKAGLEDLKGRKVVFTNSSRAFAERMTKHLGIRDHFEDIFSIEDGNFLPKPQEEPYLAVLRNFNIKPEKSAMFDDMEVNLKTAAGLGMTTVWIHGDDKTPETHALEHLHHKTEKLADFLREHLPRKE